MSCSFVITGARQIPAPNIDIIIKVGEEEREEGWFDKGARAPVPAAPNIIDNYFKRKEKEEYGWYPLNIDADITGISTKHNKF